MSDELFKALVIIGIFVIPFFILFAIDEQSNNDLEPKWVKNSKLIFFYIPFIGLSWGIGFFLKALF
jgi:hypothetical protein